MPVVNYDTKTDGQTYNIIRIYTKNTIHCYNKVKTRHEQQNIESDQIFFEKKRIIIKQQQLQHYHHYYFYCFLRGEIYFDLNFFVLVY